MSLLTRPRARLSLATVLLAATALPAHSQRQGWDKGLDAQIDSVRTAWHVPGIAVAIVSKGRVLSYKSYGFKDLESKVPVTPKTEFAIGSVSKSFTVTGLAAQVKQGKLDWDRPVREYLPTFRMYDPEATERMTTRDLVTHRSGLPRHDLMWGRGMYTREQLVDRLRYLEPTHEFRSYWQYQNLMFATAGYLSGKLNNSAWEDVVRDAVLKPLGMSNTNFSVNDMQRAPDFAFAYVANEKDSVFRVPYRNLDAIGPAG
jgi:CubicO group peptidase (beta-lactamase class C family)